MKGLQGLIAFALLAGSAMSQDRFWDEIQMPASGFGCAYTNVIGQTSPGYPATLGCWGYGTCYNTNVVDVSFYQSWACVSPNWVKGWGSSDLLYKTAWDYYTNQWRTYPGGGTAGAAAEVHKMVQGLWVITTYSGVDEYWCDNTSYYTGPYNYTC